MPGNRALALFALAALLLAMPAALAQVPPEVPEAPAMEPLAQPAEQVEEQAEGEVSAVEDNTITISTAEGEELVLNVTESTRVTKEGIEELGMGIAGLEQIAEGDRVSVSYNPESMEALSIDVLPAEEPLLPGLAPEAPAEPILP